tara:strand:- start:17462 stop:18121 length:660 start_codon:yes stop_codon:yes gene_type:complete
MKSFAIILSLAFITASLSAQEDTKLPKSDADGWMTLFNGKDLSGWDGDPKVWRVKDGYISGAIEKLEGGNTFLVFKKPFSDFVLEADCVLVGRRGNSGIQYRSKQSERGANKWVVKGYQADFGNGLWGKLYEEGGRGVLAFDYKDKAPSVKGDDGWNSYRITAKGSKLTHEINGTVTIELDDQDEKKAAKEGIIGLQYHSPGGFEVRFKNIRIKLLETK